MDSIKLYIIHAHMATKTEDVCRVLATAFGDSVTSIEEEIVDGNISEYKRYWIDIDGSIPCVERDKSLSQLYQYDTMLIGFPISWVNHDDAFDPLTEIRNELTFRFKPSLKDKEIHPSDMPFILDWYRVMVQADAFIKEDNYRIYVTINYDPEMTKKEILDIIDSIADTEGPPLTIDGKEYQVFQAYDTIEVCDKGKYKNLLLWSL